MKTTLSENEMTRIRNKCGAFLSNEMCLEIHEARCRVKIKVALRMAGVKIPTAISRNLEKLERLSIQHRLPPPKE